MGKTNGYTLTNPEAKASDRRRFAIYCAVGVDVRECDLTNKQAHELLDAANSGQAYTVRAAVAQLDNAVVRRQSVSKRNKGQAKPRGYKDPYVAPKAPKKAKAANKPDPEVDELEATLMALCNGDKAKARAIVAIMAGKPESEIGTKPKPKPKAKPKAKPVAKKAVKKAAPKKDDGGNGSVNLKDILNQIMEEENANVAPL